MKVSELFRRLSLGELSNLAAGNSGAGAIPDSKKAALILYTNNGLKRLYSRFVLQESDLVLRTSVDRTNYVLKAEHAQSNNPAAVDPELYIIDTETNPFTGNLVKILHVSNSFGQDLPLNVQGNRDSLRTPRPDTLVVPNPIEDTLLTVTYQTLHPTIEDGDEDQIIDLPDVLEPALTAYIACKLYGDMNGKEHAANAEKHRNKFEEICIEVEMGDLLGRSEVGKYSRFERNGWI